MKTIRELIEDRARALNVMKDLHKRAADESRELTDDENLQYDKAASDFDKMTRSIQQAETLKKADATIDAEERSHKPGKQTETKPEYRAAFEKYARWGMIALDPEERAVLKAEYRGTDPQTTATGTGGYTIPEEFSNELEVQLAEWGGMIEASRTIRTTTGATLPWPVVNDTAAVGVIQTEGTAIAVNDFDDTVISYGAYTLGTLIKASEQLLNDTGVPLQESIGEMLVRRLGAKFNAYFTTGTGSSQPTGLLAASGGTSAGVTAGATSITRANILDLLHSVNPAYRRSNKAYFMFNDATLAYIRKLSLGSADDTPLWQASMREGAPDMLEGKPYIINQDMPSIGTGLKSMAFGDFSKYIIRQVGGLTIRRLEERYAEELNVGFLAWQRADAKLLQTAAIKHLVHS